MVLSIIYRISTIIQKGYNIITTSQFVSYTVVASDCWVVRDNMQDGIWCASSIITSENSFISLWSRCFNPYTHCKRYCSKLWNEVCIYIL